MLSRLQRGAMRASLFGTRTLSDFNYTKPAQQMEISWARMEHLITVDLGWNSDQEAEIARHENRQKLIDFAWNIPLDQSKDLQKKLERLELSLLSEYSRSSWGIKILESGDHKKKLVLIEDLRKIVDQRVENLTEENRVARSP